ncbi:MAG TPA: radical SAM family heme chaperone HemW [Acidobacteriaceae bacterium]|nr:radical SAM family heme chaperone HemW [Acidobacteriaceae bacterium]
MELLGLYLSIPFCRSKCTYCNFASGVFPAAYHERYVARLEEDLRVLRSPARSWNLTLPEATGSIYLGGGTPTLLSPALIRRLFTALRREFAVMPMAEITVECAPGQLEPAVLDTLVDVGVSRISLGVQSFIDSEARQTGRLHTRAVALEEIARVRAAGIPAVSVDLIAGLPGQTLDSWFESVEVLADSGVDHASIYMLEVDDESQLGREMLLGGGRYHAQQVPDDDRIAEMYIEAIGLLAGHGLAQYEISNFARPGHESRHNLKYWRRAPYLGFGLDAHSMLRSRSGAALRFATTVDLDAYLAGPAWPESPRPLSREEGLEEAWFLGLRLNEGVSLAALRKEFSASAVRACLETVAELEGEGLLRMVDGDRVALTPRGRLLSNDVFSRFLHEPAAA